ncbi:hypothetical protein NP493_693g00014 [Ridgeia piscesae]|uniref:Serine aminopeptidase S33 domain-containing protein n=1 Tax=Ridgeia piscesae TaxID=27915 RepID=A0AAD9KRJ1_RIDPI|nr:hypothetical protein NP493_693g00014 [Ridgeia piscesae]
MDDTAKQQTDGEKEDADSFFKNKNGYKIFGKYWYPKRKEDEQPRGLVFIAHGVGEHCQRYDCIANPLTDNGFLVFSHDHVGHGKSEGVRVDIVHFTDYTNDVVQHVDLVKAKYPGCPVFIIGHSMGGTIVVKTVLDNPDICRGIVLIAPSLQVDPNLVGPVKIFAVRLVSRCAPRLPVGRIDSETVCHDQAVIDDYDNDPLVWHGGLKARWGVCFFDTMDEIGERMSEIQCPLLNLHGDADKLTTLEGSQLLQDKAGSKDKTLKVIPGGYHELHFEPDGVGTQCIKDIVSWIGERAQ